MKLTLILSRADDSFGTPIDTRSFQGGSISLGRGEDNDWVLDDPNRHLSKHHCAIDFQGGQIFVTDTSTNGVFVNGAAERLGRGNSQPLQDGDTVTLGEYQLLARIETGGAVADSGSIADELEDDFGLAPGGGFDADTDPFAEDSDLPGHADRPDEDPFAEFEAPGGGAGPLVGDDWGEQAPAPQGAADIIPDDFDLLGDAAEDEALALPEDHGDLAPESEFFRPPRAVPETPRPEGAIPDDWDIDAGPVPKEQTVPPPGVAAPRPQPARPPAPSAEAPRPTPVRPAAPAPVAPASTPAASGDLLAAFLAGAGLEPADLPPGDAEETMRMLGGAFREMVKGLHENLLARSEIKSEFRLERTMIRPQENNPLKFSPTVDEALRALLKGGHGGAYLAAEPAVREGFKDIKAHQIAVMAGMQTALGSLLRRFAPEHLEKRLKRQSVLDSILPAARKAKYWELYEDMYKQIAEEAEDDFQSLFGKEFAGAYESQVKKL